MLNTLLAQSRTPVGVAGLPPIVAAVCHVSISVFHVRSTNRPTSVCSNPGIPPIHRIWFLGSGCTPGWHAMEWLAMGSFQTVATYCTHTFSGQSFTFNRSRGTGNSLSHWMSLLKWILQNNWASNKKLFYRSLNTNGSTNPMIMLFRAIIFGNYLDILFTKVNAFFNLKKKIHFSFKINYCGLHQLTIYSGPFRSWTFWVFNAWA